MAGPAQDDISPSSPSSREAHSASKAARRPLRLVIVLSVLAGLGVAGYLLSRSGENEESCIATVAEHAPDGQDERWIAIIGWGGDMERARDAGFDDSSFDDIVDSFRETGVIPDHLYFEPLMRMNADRTPPETAGYDSSQVTCWIGRHAGDDEMVALGTFDATSVASSARGRHGEVDTSGEVLASHGDGRTEDLLEPGDAPSSLSEMIQILDDQEAVNFVIFHLGDEDAPAPPAAVALAYDDGWDLLLVWRFSDETEAAVGRDAVEEILTEGSAVPDLVEGDPAEHVDQDGTQVTMRLPLTSPTRWILPVMTLDRVLDPLR
jgi:hypothetical protein